MKQSKLKQLYLYGNKLSYKAEERRYILSKICPQTGQPLVNSNWISIPGIPVENPPGKYLLQFKHLSRRGYVEVIVLDAPNIALTNLVLTMSSTTFNKCSFRIDNHNLLIEGNFQIRAGNLEHV